MMTVAEVSLWGTRVGAVAIDRAGDVARFEYDPAFTVREIEIAPIQMPIGRGGIWRFPALDRQTFEGLPGLLSDALPDRYGRALIDAWLAREGRSPVDFDAVERLCYVGTRAMGALEFLPATGPDPSEDERVDVARLAALAAEVLDEREGLGVGIGGEDSAAAMRQILRVGTSAGGARAKALIALDPGTDEVRSGQIDLPPPFEYWILKFDGVDDFSRELGGALGYGAIEYVYSELAARAGIVMSECRLLEEGGRRHFMTRRFDRDATGDRLHMQSLGALAHLDYRLAGANSYEQAFDVIRRLDLPPDAAEQQFRRMVFNVVARNQDDHVKNIAFLMDRDGRWSLSPAFDVTYSYNPNGPWTARHQMSINGKVDDLTIEDLLAVARAASIKRGRPETILAEVTEAVKAWPELADRAGVDSGQIEAIAATHRLELRRG
ncbi:type II toxin-antitoxin system HipA family toxin [Thermoleophilia bacterium SCSIO 60948]|nr:type II toxin-antitoxin system HipA family toxin [Thermoleophilia bacterium SCSIO 60948]